MSKLTVTKIEKYKPKAKDERLADGSGLYIRFRSNQVGKLSRVWMYAYKTGTRSFYMVLGDYLAGLPTLEANLYKLEADPTLTLENARRIAIELTSWRKRKLDPKEHFKRETKRLRAESEAQEKAAALLQEAAAVENLTLQDLFDAWLKDGVRRRDGNAELQRAFKADVLPKLARKKVTELTEHDLRIVLRTMVSRGVNRAAVIMRNDLTQMFTWAEKRQPWRRLLVSGNPVDLIEIEKLVSPDYDLNNQRDRILSPDEVRELHSIFQQLQLNYDNAPNKRSTGRPIEATTQCAIWIMLSTLCRVGELTMARWEHINLDAGEWFIPRKNVKGRTSDLTIYLSNFTANQFQRLKATTGHSEWCFPSRNNESHVCVKSISKQVGDRQTMFKRSKDGGPRQPMNNRKHDNSLVLSDGKNGAWTPHDLRRTGATMMQSLGVILEIIDRCQNHVLEGSKVRRHYLHHDYAEEKREAWRLLGERLELILRPANNVVLLQEGCDLPGFSRPS